MTQVLVMVSWVAGIVEAELALRLDSSKALGHLETHFCGCVVMEGLLFEVYPCRADQAVWESGHSGASKCGGSSLLCCQIQHVIAMLGQQLFLGKPPVSLVIQILSKNVISDRQQYTAASTTNDNQSE